MRIPAPIFLLGFLAAVSVYSEDTVLPSKFYLASHCRGSHKSNHPSLSSKSLDLIHLLTFTICHVDSAPKKFFQGIPNSFSANMNLPLSVLNAENFAIEALSCSERVKLDALMDVAVYEKC